MRLQRGRFSVQKKVFASQIFLHGLETHRWSRHQLQEVGAEEAVICAWKVQAGCQYRQVNDFSKVVHVKIWQAESRQGGFPLATPASTAGWNFGEDLEGQSWRIAEMFSYQLHSFPHLLYFTKMLLYGKLTVCQQNLSPTWFEQCTKWQ